MRQRISLRFAFNSFPVLSIYFPELLAVEDFNRACTLYQVNVLAPVKHERALGLFQGPLTSPTVESNSL